MSGSAATAEPTTRKRRAFTETAPEPVAATLASAAGAPADGGDEAGSSTEAKTTGEAETKKRRRRSGWDVAAPRDPTLALAQKEAPTAAQLSSMKNPAEVTALAIAPPSMCQRWL